MTHEKLFYSIGEVAEMLEVNTSMLRFWETEFSELRPLKNKRGIRSYTQKDIDLLRRIIYLTKDCGLTLDGTRQQLRNGKTPDKQRQMVETLTEIKNFLLEMKQNI